MKLRDNQIELTVLIPHRVIVDRNTGEFAKSTYCRDNFDAAAQRAWEQWKQTEVRNMTEFEQHGTVELTVLVPTKVEVKKDTGETSSVVPPTINEVKPLALGAWNSTHHAADFSREGLAWCSIEGLWIGGRTITGPDITSETARYRAETGVLSGPVNTNGGYPNRL